MEAVIRLTMRMLALLLAATVAITIVLLLRAGVESLRALTQSRLGIATLIQWGVTLLAGPFAVAQMLRLRNSGRLAGALVFGTMTLYYVAAASFLRDPGDPAMPAAFVAMVVGACAAFLLLPATRHACER